MLKKFLLITTTTFGLFGATMAQAATTLVLPHFFSNDTVFQLSNIDLDFNAVVNYLNATTGSFLLGTDSGTANNYTITVSPAVTNLQTAFSVVFVPANTNTTASVMNISNLGAKTICKDSPSGCIPTVAGDMQTAGQVMVTWDPTNQVFHLFNPQSIINTIKAMNPMTFTAAMVGANTGVLDSGDLFELKSALSTTPVQLDINDNASGAGAAACQVFKTGTVSSNTTLCLNDNTGAPGVTWLSGAGVSGNWSLDFSANTNNSIKLKSGATGNIQLIGPTAVTGNLTNTGTYTSTGQIIGQAGLAVTGAGTFSTTLGVTGVTTTSGLSNSANSVETSYTVSTTNGAYCATIPNTQRWWASTTGVTDLACTVTLPASPVDGQTVTIINEIAMTAHMSIAANAGQTALGNPSNATTTVGQAWTCRYNASGTKWYCSN